MSADELFVSRIQEEVHRGFKDLLANGALSAMVEMLKYTNENPFNVVKMKKKILSNFKNSASARIIQIHKMEIGYPVLVIQGDSDISVYLKLAGIIYVSGGAALDYSETRSGQKLLNALCTAFGMVQKNDKINSKKITLSRIIACFPYIACEAHKNGYGKIPFPFPYSVYPKFMLTIHFGSLIPKELLKTSSPDGACCIHSLIFSAINNDVAYKNGATDSADLFKSVLESIESLAIREKRKHKILDLKFEGLTTGVFGGKNYAWNYVAWSAFTKAKELMYEMESNTAKELYNLAEDWRKS